MKKETDKNLQYVLKYYAAGRLDTRKALKAVRQRAGISVRRPSPWRWVGMAATLLVLIAAGAYMWLRLSTTTLEAGSSVVAYTLDDGTCVTLSPHSTLSYRKADCRTVAMTGHIYFQVRHDEQHPFDIDDFIHPNASETLTVRSLIIIDPNKKVRLIITYPASTGRNFNEILRVIDSLQLTDNYKVATPANWQDGEDVVIVPSIQDEAELKQRFPNGYQAIKPYLRLTKQPNRT